jgi:hypothetical protein
MHPKSQTKNFWDFVMWFLSVTNKKETVYAKSRSVYWTQSVGKTDRNVDTIGRKTSHNSLIINKKPTLRISAEGWTILT